jgi:membrane-associated phospholipid phosphatase
MQNVPEYRAPAAAAAGQVSRLARYLSILGHPFIVIPASVAASSVLRGGDARAALGVAGLFIAVSVLVLVGIKAGRFNDFDVSERQRRPGFYVLLASATLAFGAWRREEPEVFRACALAGAVLITCGLLNRYTKVSLHTAFALYAAGFWGAWSSGAGLVALPIAAAVAWSRVHLGRHSAREVLVGAAVGLVAASVLVLFAGPFDMP